MTKSRIVRNASASLAQVILTAALFFITYRLLFNYLTIEEIGLWALIVGSLAVAKLAEFGLGAGVMRLVAADIAAGDKDKAALSIGMAVVCSTILVMAIGFVAYPLILPWVLNVAPKGLKPAAEALFFTASLAVAIGTPGSIFLGAIDGCQRMDMRAGIQVAGNVLQLALTFILLPNGGVAALGYVQIAQACFLILAGFSITVYLIGARPSSYWGFDKYRLLEIIAYGGSLQLSAIAQIFFEPLAKILLTAFGGLALTGYFEVANRLITQLRGIIVAAYTSMVPYVAARVGSTKMSNDEITSIYEKSVSLLIFGLIPYFATASTALPLILTLWQGQFDSTLIAVALMLLFGWSINTLNIPAYMIFMALGKVRPLIISHALIGAFTLSAGLFSGWLFGGIGVLIATALGLIVGSAQLLYSFHQYFKIPFSNFFSKSIGHQILLFIFSFSYTIASVAYGSEYKNNIFALLIPPVITSFLGFSLAFFSDDRIKITYIINRLIKSK